MNYSFSSIPDCVYDIETLEILLATNNQISFINVDGLMKLKPLATLDLSNNHITNVPFELGNMKHLR